MAKETKEINENIYIDLDKSGNLVSMTIEHAKSQANIFYRNFIGVGFAVDAKGDIIHITTDRRVKSC